MPRNAQAAVIGIDSFSLEIHDGTDFQPLPGLSGITINAGTREGNSVQSDTSGPAAVATGESAPQIEFEGYKMPFHGNWDVVTTRYRNKLRSRFRFRTTQIFLGETTAGSNTAAIAADGVVTFAGDAPNENDLKEAAAIEISGTDYFLNSVNPDTLAATVKPAPSSAVSAANYRLRIPSVELDFSGFILMTPSLHASATQGGELSGQLQVQVDGVLPEWTVRASS